MKKKFKISVSKIKSSLAMNKLEIAINDTVQLMRDIKDEELESNAIIISARFYKDLGKEIVGIKSTEDIESNKLIVSIIKLLNLAEKTITEFAEESLTQELRVSNG